MKFTLSFLIALLIPSFAQAQLANMPSAPVLAAKSYLLYDVTSNQILVDQNGNDRNEPASLTKLMTAYMTFNSLKLNKLTLSQTVYPSTEALLSQGTEPRMFLDEKKPVSISDLLRGLIVQSANDAARVLAITIAGSEENFAKRMNQEAQRLGMGNTHYINSTGTPHPQHYSSAYDTALLAAAIVRDFPEHYKLYSLREFQYNDIKQSNRNRLLWMDPYVDGIKTGHTESTGFCLVASAKRNQRRLISVVLGASSENSRAIESQKLLNYGFKNFESVRLYQKNAPVASLRLWKGTESTVKIGFRSDLFLSIPTGQMTQLKATMETQQPLIAPIAGGQQVGILKITLGGEPYAEYKLVALEPMPRANVFSRGWDSIRLLFK